MYQNLCGRCEVGYENCNGAPISIIDGKYKADDAMKGPLGKKALTPLRGAANFDPTDPAV